MHLKYLTSFHNKLNNMIGTNGSFFSSIDKLVDQFLRFNVDLNDVLGGYSCQDKRESNKK